MDLRGKNPRKCWLKFCLSAGTRSGITSAAPCDPDNRRPRRTADRPLWSTERTVSGRWSCECKRTSFTVREKRKPETVPLRTPKRFPRCGGNSGNIPERLIWKFLFVRRWTVRHLWKKEFRFIYSVTPGWERLFRKSLPFRESADKLFRSTQRSLFRNRGGM